MTATSPISMRDMTARDIPHLFALSQAVAWPHREEDLRFLLGLGHGVAATGPDGAVEGCAAWWPFGAAVASVGLVIVRPDLQGRGIGGALMRRALDAAGPRRLHLHATEAGRALYERSGFVAVGLVRQHQGVAQPGEIGRASGVRPLRPDDRTAVLALDAAAVDADRSALFDALAALGHGFAYEEGGRITGFAFRRAFGRGQVLGPLAGETGTAALALLKAGVQAAAGAFLRVDTPVDDAAFRHQLTAMGLPEVATAVPMVRGGPARPAGPARVYALAAQALV